MAPRGEPPNQSKAAKKRQYASRTPQARSYKSPKISQAGVGNLPVTVARAAMTIARYVAKNQAKPTSAAKPKASKPKPQSASKPKPQSASKPKPQSASKPRDGWEARAKAKAENEARLAAQRKKKKPSGYYSQGGAGTISGKNMPYRDQFGNTGWR